MSDAGYVDYMHDNGLDLLPVAIVRQMNDCMATSPQSISNILSLRDQTGAPTIYIVPYIADAEDSIEDSSIPGQLKKIKEKFGLNLSQLSKVLNVSRPQLYKWMEGEAIPQRDEFNQKINGIFSLIGEIPAEHSQYFGKLANRYTDAGKTVIDMLTDSEFDKTMLLSIYESIKDDIESIERRKIKEMDKRKHNVATEVVLPPNDVSA